MINLDFDPNLWIILNVYYDEEWEGFLRPSTGEFTWQYVVFYGDKCVSCPVIWVATKKVLVTGFQLQLMDGMIFQSSNSLQKQMYAGDTLSLDQFIIPRNLS